MLSEEDKMSSERDSGPENATISPKRTEKTLFPGAPLPEQISKPNIQPHESFKKDHSVTQEEKTSLKANSVSKSDAENEADGVDNGDLPENSDSAASDNATIPANSAPANYSEKIMESQLNDSEIINLLNTRDAISHNFSQLFVSQSELASYSLPARNRKSTKGDTGFLEQILGKCKAQLLEKERQNTSLNEVIETQKTEIRHLQDEMLSMNIENNLLHQELLKRQTEYDKLVERWMAKAQQDADAMNANF